MKSISEASREFYAIQGQWFEKYQERVQKYLEKSWGFKFRMEIIRAYDDDCLQYRAWIPTEHYRESPDSVSRRDLYNAAMDIEEELQEEFPECDIAIWEDQTNGRVTQSGRVLA